MKGERQTESSTRLFLFSLLGMGVDSEEKSQKVCYSARDETGEIGSGETEGKGKIDLQSAYLLPWQEWPVGNQGVPAEVAG